MPLNLDEVRMFSGMEIRKGDVILYSADFNGGLNKADVEIESLHSISDNGGISVILAHKGRYGKDTPHLKDFEDYLRKKLRKDVFYFEENNTPAAVEYVGALEPGDIAIMGNARMHEGEEKNDSVLARQFADLALRNDENARLVVGGPGKAHRKNASNYSIQDSIPAYAAPSLINEMQAIEPWAGKSREYSVAVLGGVKGEKIKDGLTGFAETYDAIILGGIALNTILKAKGVKIGKSVIDDDGKTFEKYAEKVLKSNNAHKLRIPEKIIIAKPCEGGFEDAGWTTIEAGVPDNYMIVDFVLPYSALDALWKLEKEGGRLAVVGTPGIAKEGFTKSTDAIMNYANNNNIKTLIMGGDAINEMKSGNAKYVSIGGSGLHYITNGTTPVWEKLKENKKKFAAYYSL